VRDSTSCRQRWSAGAQRRWPGVRAVCPKGPASAVFFIATDCPISNWYAPTIQQVCRDYAARGVDCTLVYEDLDFGATPAALDAEVRTHLREYRYGSLTATVDRTRAVATRARATVTRRWCSSIVPARSGIAAASTTAMPILASRVST
jgi:hypothetical protein